MGSKWGASEQERFLAKTSASLKELRGKRKRNRMDFFILDSRLR